MPLTRKNKIFVLTILILVLISFSIGFLIAKDSWTCPYCSYNSGKITPLLNEQYYPALMSKINSAESSIDIVLYEFKWYNTNNSVVKLRDALIDSNKRGVRVRLLLDQSKWYGQLTDLSYENKQTGEFLANHGIFVKFDSETKTTHDKLVIVDNETVLLGSHNWGSSALTKNNEASVMIQDEEISAYYLNYFEYLWQN